jgi:hypothetical protein
LLDVLCPDFRKSDPQKAAELDQEEQMRAFTSKVNSGLATMPAILEGLKEFPKAAPAVGEFLARGTSDAQKAEARKALGALAEALLSLNPSPDEPYGVDRGEAIRRRELLANAMQKIAPELPKPIFTPSDVDAIHKILFDPAQRADPNRRARVSAARKLAQWPAKGPFDVSPDQIRRLLDAVKGADAPTYDALVAKVKEIDPHFPEDSQTIPN